MDAYSRSQEWDDEDEERETAYAVNPRHVFLPSQHGVTTKVPPAFDGRSSWFQYEEAIDEWCDITELEPTKRGPALRDRLLEEAAVYKPLLDRDQLRDPENGVQYFKTAMRPHFVKGSQSVFLWRFLQLFKMNRGNRDFISWLGRMSVQRKRVQDAWMDLRPPTPPDHQDIAPAVEVMRRELQEVDRQRLYQQMLRQHRQDAERAILAQQPVPDEPQQPQLPPVRPLTREEEIIVLGRINQMHAENHRTRFPLNEHLFALLLVVLADLTEQQRERFMSTLALRNVQADSYTFEIVRSTFMELFCAPRSSIENPNLRPATGQRSFCVIEYGELDGVCGNWVEDDETGEEGFVPD